MDSEEPSVFTEWWQRAELSVPVANEPESQLDIWATQGEVYLCIYIKNMKLKLHFYAYFLI